MNELDCIRIVGTAFALEKCQVLIHTGKVHSNGIEARVALSMLEFQVSVRTFFLGTISNALLRLFRRLSRNKTKLRNCAISTRCWLLRLCGLAKNVYYFASPIAPLFPIFRETSCCK